jgi:hypothetical protein
MPTDLCPVWSMMGLAEASFSEAQMTAPPFSRPGIPHRLLMQIPVQRTNLGSAYCAYRGESAAVPGGRWR